MIASRRLKLRSLMAGTVIGSGTVANQEAQVDRAAWLK